MARAVPWRVIAIATSATSVVFALLLLPACCCRGRSSGPVTAPPQAVIPPIGVGAMPTPTEAAAKAPTQAQMRNVWFHIDESAFLDIHSMRGVLMSKEAGTPLNFDNKLSFVMQVDSAKIGLNSASLDVLLNRYVFNDAGAPLRDLHASIKGSQLVQQGIVHKIIDIPFTMWADVSASSGRIRIHPTRMDICGLNGLALLKAVGMTLEKMIGKGLPHEKGVTAEGNDLLMDPGKLLPPPEIELHLVGVHTEGDELIQIYDAGRKLPPLTLPHPEIANYMYFREGTLRMGKLLMVDADMEVADMTPDDPFDFYIDRYNEQLVAGTTHNQPNYGLLVFMRDFNKLGSHLESQRNAQPGVR